MMRKLFEKKIFVAVFIFLLPLLICLQAREVFADNEGDAKTFFINKSFDSKGREQISAFLQKAGNSAYFYLDREWFDSLESDKKAVIQSDLNIISLEFDNVIYPKLTEFYGQEWNPGIDSDRKITILFHPMIQDASGYFTNGDEYSKYQIPTSNEREMIYVNSSLIFYTAVKSYIAHEFTHLITFNQKDRLRNVGEEVWLNELRAEYAPTYLKYDDDYVGSNLEQRVKQFLSNPSAPLTEWLNQSKDYGVVNIFGEYLTDHYNPKILGDSLKSSKIGIPSLSEALQLNGVTKSFSDVFTDFTIAVFLNDCSLKREYCFSGPNLSRFKISPSLIFLPSTEKTQFRLDYSTKEWAGNWYRIVGGHGDLKISFSGESRVTFKIPYVICGISSNCEVRSIALNYYNSGEVTIKDFGTTFGSLTIIPSVQNKLIGFDGREPSYNFSISASMQMKGSTGGNFDCSQIRSNLYFGMVNNNEVRCLQQILKNEGQAVYREGYVTGNFYSLTYAAVIRFQEKYASEILAPTGLRKGTGYVGPATRKKINELLLK